MAGLIILFGGGSRDTSSIRLGRKVVSHRMRVAAAAGLAGGYRKYWSSVWV